MLQWSKKSSGDLKNFIKYKLKHISIRVWDSIPEFSILGLANSAKYLKTQVEKVVKYYLFH